MKFEGGCYCGKIRYLAEGEPRLKAQCHCRECQYISGGAPNMFMLIAPQGFRYTSGEPRKFSRSDLESPVTREFCGECGTHLTTPACRWSSSRSARLIIPVYSAHLKWRSTPSTNSPSMSFQMACRRLSVCLRASCLLQRKSGGVHARPLAREDGRKRPLGPDRCPAAVRQ
jgi:hypothetical protein